MRNSWLECDMIDAATSVYLDFVLNIQMKTVFQNNLSMIEMGKGKILEESAGPC